MPEIRSRDPKVIARTHYNELQQYLVAYLAKSPANSRSTARQKLTRLTKQQFQELSTDVYDELVRRKTNTPENEMPCLPARDEFHPKRDRARQKLATLPTARFEDLLSDVYFELSRRYPEFKEENEVGTAPVGSRGPAYDDMPSTEPHASPTTSCIKVELTPDIQKITLNYERCPQTASARLRVTVNGHKRPLIDFDCGATGSGSQSEAIPLKKQRLAAQPVTAAAVRAPQPSPLSSPGPSVSRASFSSSTTAFTAQGLVSSSNSPSP